MCTNERGERYMRYKISDLAKLLGVSTNTVRRYEDMGYISVLEAALFISKQSSLSLCLKYVI